MVVRRYGDVRRDLRFSLAAWVYRKMTNSVDFVFRLGLYPKTEQRWDRGGFLTRFPRPEALQIAREGRRRLESRIERANVPRKSSGCRAIRGRLRGELQAGDTFTLKGGNYLHQRRRESARRI
jgi:hypothetical protein